MPIPTKLVARVFSQYLLQGFASADTWMCVDLVETTDGVVMVFETTSPIVGGDYEVKRVTVAVTVAQETAKVDPHATQVLPIVSQNRPWGSA